MVGAKIVGIKGSKIIIQHSVVSEKLNRKAAEGEAHVVWYDYEKQKKAEIPGNLKQELLKYII